MRTHKCVKPTTLAVWLKVVIFKMIAAQKGMSCKLPLVLCSLYLICPLLSWLCIFRKAIRILWKVTRILRVTPGFCSIHPLTRVKQTHHPHLAKAKRRAMQASKGGSKGARGTVSPVFHNERQPTTNESAAKMKSRVIYRVWASSYVR